MITQRDLEGIMPNSCRPGAIERPQHPELPGVAAVVAEQLGSSLLRVTVRLTSLASQARSPLRDHLLAQVEEIDELMHAVRDLLVPARGDAPADAVCPTRVTRAMAAARSPASVNATG